MLRRSIQLVLVIVVMSVIAREGRSLIMISKTGDWPKNWPEELEPLRELSRTLNVGTGIQECIYEIRVADRETFERAWPAILEIKTLGAPLTLHRQGSDTDRSGGLLSNSTPVVRIYGPSRGNFIPAGGEKLESGPPWPEDITGDDGSLPEYVAPVVENGETKWTALENPGDAVGFAYRARVEVHLVVDGEIIDLNRIMLPPETPIVDLRDLK